jgi:phosphoglycerol transferase MdoB-like AlkP superfamily enzyme
MVIAQSKGSSRADLGLFVARNGIQRLFDVSDFPSQAEKLGLGATDNALFDFLARRVEMLQAAGQPFFVTTLTIGTHSPFKVPIIHPEVGALRQHPWAISRRSETSIWRWKTFSRRYAGRDS